MKGVVIDGYFSCTLIISLFPNSCLWEFVMSLMQQASTQVWHCRKYTLTKVYSNIRLYMLLRWTLFTYLYYLFITHRVLSQGCSTTGPPSCVRRPAVTFVICLNIYTLTVPVRYATYCDFYSCGPRNSPRGRLWPFGKKCLDAPASSLPILTN